MFYCGIDVAKREHDATVVNQEGRQLFHQRFRNRRESAEAFVQALEQKLGTTVAQVEFILEATGHYWMALHAFLENRGARVRVINPIQSDVARNLYIRKTKTDKRDSFILADLLRMDRAQASPTPNPATLRLQALTRTRVEFVDQVVALKQRVIGLLDRVFPEYERLFSDVFLKSSRALLQAFSTPEELLAADLSEVAALLNQTSRGRFGQVKAQELQVAARTTFGLAIAGDAIGLQMRLLLSQIDFIEGQIKILDEAIDHVLNEITADRPLDQPFRHVLETIPSVGPTVLATLLAEIGDIRRFPSPKQLTAFAGVDSSIRASGESAGGHSHMSKRGSPYLRRSLWYAAQAAKNADPRFGEFYARKLAEGDHPGKAAGALMHKLLVHIFHVWKSGRPYDPNHQWTTTSKKPLDSR